MKDIAAGPLAIQFFKGLSKVVWTGRLARQASVLLGSGSLGARFIQREIVRSEISKPSMRSSP